MDGIKNIIIIYGGFIHHTTITKWYNLQFSTEPLHGVPTIPTKNNKERMHGPAHATFVYKYENFK